MRASAWAGALIVLTGFTAACAGQSAGPAGPRQSAPISHPAPTSIVVPWLDRPAAPYVEPTPAPPPANARPCRPTELTVTNPRYIGAGLGNTNLVLKFTNRSTAACVLNGYPTVMGVSASGALTALPVGHGSYFGDPGPPANISPGQLAAVNVSGDDACALAQSGEHRVYPFLRIGLPAGGGVIARGALFDAICGVSVSRFGVPADQQPPANPRPSPLTATISATGTVHSGADFNYTVTLTNQSDAAYSLRPCPTYGEYITAIAGAQVSGVNKNYYLNCDTVHEIEAHHSVTYQMMLQLPAGLPATQATKFGWQLHTDSGPFTNAQLQILP